MMARLSKNIPFEHLAYVIPNHNSFSAFPNSLYPAFYVTRLIGFLRPATMSLARSLRKNTHKNSLVHHW